MAAGLGLAAKAAISWDTAWTGVQKTVDGTPEQLAEVEKGLRDLAKTLPASHAEIAAVAETAGQLGVKTEDVVDFTKTMIDLGETTNLSAEQAATSLARFMNIMGTSNDDVAKLGASLVGLGNSLATTEAEILEMATRLAKAGVQVGLTEGEVLGLAAALSSVGIKAEAGGTAMSKIMIDIAAAVETGSDDLTKFATIAGVSAEQFSAAWKSNPGKALSLFVTGLANAEKQGKSTLGLLEELGVAEAGMREALLGSAAAADKFTGALDMGNREFQKGTALTDEANKRYETTAAKLQMLGNKVTDAGISLGKHLLPAIEVVAEGIGGFADMLSGLDGPLGAVVAWGGVLAAGVLLLGGAYMTVIPKIAAYKIALETLGVAGKGVTGVMKGMMGVVGGPWGIAIAAATLLISGLSAAMQDAKLEASDLATSIKQGANGYEVLDLNLKDVQVTFRGVKQAATTLPALIDKVMKQSETGFTTLRNAESAALDKLREYSTALSTLSSQDLPLAQKAFKELYEGSNLDKNQALYLLNNQMKEYKNTLVDIAHASGLATDDSTILQLALGEIPASATNAAGAIDEQVNSLEELQDAARVTESEVSALADEIRNFGSAQFDTERASIKFHDALADLQKQLAEGKGSLDVTTEAGRDTMSSMLDVAKATNDYAAAVANMGGSTEEVNEILEAGRQYLFNTYYALTNNEEAAKRYVDRLITFPENLETKIKANTSSAESTLKNFLWSWNGRTVLVNAVVGRTGTTAQATGGMFAYANGGVEAYAGGGFPSGIYKGGAPIHKFAEPETGWESYISGKPDVRDRNRQIWVETGNRLGVFDEIKQVLAALAAGGAGAGNTTNFVFNNPVVRDDFAEIWNETDNRYM
nr:phage tail tape measure protein [Canibacter oris]